MTPDLTLALLVGTPILIIMLLRVNAALVFLALALGSVLNSYLGPDVADLVNLFGKQGNGNGENLSQATVQLILLLLPVVLMLILMIKTVPMGLKLALNIVPAIGSGLLAALLVVPLLPGGVAHGVMASGLWGQLIHVQDLAVGISALICLVALLGLRPKNGEFKHGKKHAG